MHIYIYIFIFGGTEVSQLRAEDVYYSSKG